MKTQQLPDDFNPLEVIIPAPAVPVAPAQVPQAGQPMTASTPEEQPAETTLAETNAAYFNIADELPTGLAFSAQSKLSIRPYGLPEKYKLGAARKGGKLKYIVEAVGATIDRPVMGLALIDFWYICYWLRLMSYKADPLVAEWSCEHMDHVRKVLLEEVDADTLHNKTIIEKSNVEVIPVDQDLAAVANELMAGSLPVYIHPPTVADFLDQLENGSDWDDEFAFMADIAVYLRPNVHGAKIVDRVKWLRSITSHPDAEEKMELLKKAIAIIVRAGVKDTFDAQCKHCQTQQKVLLEVDLLTFFPV